jgi:hypothetical protein
VRLTARVFIAHLASVRVPSAHNESLCQNSPFFYDLNSTVFLMIAFLRAHANVFK